MTVAPTFPLLMLLLLVRSARGLAPGSFAGVRRRAQRTYATSMGLKTGIVGLPNVGKSTLFNALTGDVNAEAANYPFCTIDPNVGVVTVPDERLMTLAEVSVSAKIVPTSLEFVDVAGLVKGASKGEGLGNQFLANIRECDAIVHVVRCFEDENVIHVDGSVDPIRDLEVIELELGLSDLAQIERRELKAKKDKSVTADELSALKKLHAAIDDGEQARNVYLTPKEKESVESLKLLTMKPVIYACNVAENDLAEGNPLVEQVKSWARERVLVVSAQVEAELVSLEPDERNDSLETLGVSMETCGLRNLVKAAYETLGLITYYTSGDTESRAWTIAKGWTAPKAAGVIHGDFERGFIRAEVFHYDDIQPQDPAGKYLLPADLKAKGLYRSEGKDYVVRDGDVMLFRFNV